MRVCGLSRESWEHWVSPEGVDTEGTDLRLLQVRGSSHLPTTNAAGVGKREICATCFSDGTPAELRLGTDEHVLRGEKPHRNPSAVGYLCAACHALNC
jgi:hypothetical protein